MTILDGLRFLKSNWPPHFMLSSDRRLDCTGRELLGSLSVRSISYGDALLVFGTVFSCSSGYRKDGTISCGVTDSRSYGPTEWRCDFVSIRNLFLLESSSANWEGERPLRESTGPLIQGDLPSKRPGEWRRISCRKASGREVS